jgi:hypothetical protein
MTRALLVYAHVLATVFLAGFALFGAILARSRIAGGLLERAYRWRWPPRGLGPVGLPLFGLGWVALIVSAGTGALLLASRGGQAGQGGQGELGAYGAKLALVAAACLAQVALSVRPRAALLVAHFLLLLGVVTISVLLAR